MKNTLRKVFIITFALISFFCLSALGLLFRESEAADADYRATVSHDHASDTSYTALSEADGELGTFGTTSYYYLTKNTVLQNNITIAWRSTVTICLNGYILCGTGSGNVISMLQSDTTLNICDCQADSASEEHRHYYSISDNMWNFKDGSGAFLTGGDNFVTGGVITGGNYVDGGNKGGIYIGAGGTLNLLSGTIAGNKSKSGGGVFVEGAFNMQGGAICGNAADDDGGGVFVQGGCAFNMSGGVISDNFANRYGGGVFCLSESAINGSAEITDNTASTKGSGVCAFLVDIDVGGTVKISGNKKPNGSADNVYFEKGDGTGIFKITGVLNDGAAIGVYPNNYIGQAVTSGYGGTDTVKYFFSDDPKFSLCVKDGEVAVFDEWKVTLNLYKKNGEYVTDPRLTSYKYSDTVRTPLPADPVRDGYDFDGWYTTPTFEAFNKFEYIYEYSMCDQTFYAKWIAKPQNDLLGDGIKFGKHNLWDCQRIPYYPLGGSPFYIFGFRAPLDVRGDRIAFNADDYIRFEPYAGGGDVTDSDGNGVITVGELGDSDKTRIVGTLYGSSNATSETAILDALVVSEVKYDGFGNRTTLANIGLIWALGEEGFLYTALDPDCPWSYSGGVGTFISFKSRNENGGLSYVPDSPDPLGKDDLIKDSGGGDAVPVPTPEIAAPTVDSHAVIGIVVDGEGNSLDNASVSYGATNGTLRNTQTVGGGYFLFDNLTSEDYTLPVEIRVTYGSYSEKPYSFGAEELKNYDILSLVYPLSDGESGSVSNIVINSVKYMNIEGASFEHVLPATYTEGVGARLYDPTKQCHTFGGWYESAGFGGDPVTVISGDKRGDVVLYAKWTDAHTWGEWTVTRPATAEADGIQSRTCSVCGKTETRAIEYVPEVPPTVDDPPVEDEPITGDEPTAGDANEGQPTADKDSLLWLIILLAVILAAETAVLIVRIRARKKQKSNVKLSSFAALPFIAAAYAVGEIVAVAALSAAVVAVGVAIGCTFIKKKEESAAEISHEAGGDKMPETSEEQIAEEQTTAERADEQAAVKDIEPNDEEAQTLEREIAAELESDVSAQPMSEGISLKESLALAAGRAQIKIDKQSVAEWLDKNYGGEVKLNRRANKTKTGLPLADTHYVNTGAKRKCFIYVYELDGDKSMLLLKTDDDTAKEITAEHPAIVRSRFPRSRREKWYTLVPDETFGSSDEVFGIIARVIAGFTENLRAAGEDVRREIAKIEEIKTDNVTSEEAKKLISDAAATVLVTGVRHRKTGKKFAVNIDTLSDKYGPDDTVDIKNLKEKGIVPKSASQIKILARGRLDKPLTVIADDFSADAIKMIVLTGGEALWS